MIEIATRLTKWPTLQFAMTDKQKQEVEDACWTKIDESVDIGNEIQVFPNPAEKEILISSSCYKIREVNIYNQIGQKVLFTKKVTNKIDISTLPKGMYVIELISKNLKFKEKLIII